MLLTCVLTVFCETHSLRATSLSVRAVSNSVRTARSRSLNGLRAVGSSSIACSP